MREIRHGGARQLGERSSLSSSAITTLVVVEEGWVKKYWDFQVVSDITTKVVVTTFVVGTPMTCSFNLWLNKQFVEGAEQWVASCLYCQVL